MKLKLLLLIIVLCSVVLSGCWAKDIATDVVTPDKEKILGNWYDESTKAYFEFMDDGSYRSGNGLYTENAGGYYRLENGKLFLSITYTIIDAKMTIVSDLDQQPNPETILSYDFDLRNNLILHKENVRLTFIQVESLDAGKEDEPVYPIAGLYQVEEIFYYFDQNGGVTRSSNTQNTTENGTFLQEGSSLEMTIGGSKTSYTYLINNTQLVLTNNDTGQVTKLVRIK